MKALATIGVWMHKAAPGAAATMLLAALAAGCGGQEPATAAQASAADRAAATARTCATARGGADCAPAASASRREAGAPVYDVYATGNGPRPPEIEVAGLAPPPNDVEQMHVDVEVKLDPAVVLEPVRGL
ncbi:MAG TPA: hypothetical protein VIN61_01920 [Gammaproteobacteria bacterium]